MIKQLRHKERTPSKYYVRPLAHYHKQLPSVYCDCHLQRCSRQCSMKCCASLTYWLTKLCTIHFTIEWMYYQPDSDRSLRTNTVGVPAACQLLLVSCVSDSTKPCCKAMNSAHNHKHTMISYWSIWNKKLLSNMSVQKSDIEIFCNKGPVGTRGASSLLLHHLCYYTSTVNT